MSKILELWGKLWVHSKLTIVLSIFGLFCFLVIKFSIWFMIGTIGAFVAIFFVTRDKNLLKFLIPVSLIWILLAIILKG